MELNRKLIVEIEEIFRCVEYGKITFLLNPENKSLNFTIETTHHIPMEIIGTPAADEMRKVIIRRKRFE